eukprot:m.129484 g.129484  ORF g.129484 m.129484 type:complete len:1101 (+) comp37977_c0_seq5:333-3635(+)
MNLMSAFVSVIAAILTAGLAFSKKCPPWIEDNLVTARDPNCNCCDEAETKSSKHSSLEHHVFLSGNDSRRIENERSILIRFFKEMKGSAWRHKTNWNTSKSLCCWEGVLVSKRKFVFGLDLPQNGLNGTIQKFIWEIQNLTYVVLRDNEIHGNITEFLPPRRLALRKLNLSWTKINGTVPWGNLEMYDDLLEIQLDRTNISGEIDERVGFLECLHSLTLGQTQLEGEIPKTFHRLQYLYSLDLNFLGLRGSLQVFSNLTSLKFLTLEDNLISGNLPSDFDAQFPQLKILQLKDNRISGNIPEGFRFPEGMTTFDLSNNSLTGTLPTSIWNSSKIEIVSLSNNSLQYISSTSKKAHLPSLKYIDLSSNPFENLTTEKLGELFFSNKANNILNVDFSCTNLTGKLTNWPWRNLGRLVSLRLQNNSISGDFPRPPFMQYYLQVFEAGYNNLSGPIPEEIKLFRSIKLISLRGNQNLTWGKDGHLPSIAHVHKREMRVEGRNNNYSCPQIKLKTTGGFLEVSSKYYHRKFCHCSSGFYGLQGHCKECLTGATCKGNEENSTIVMHRNTYPVPDFENVIELITCDSVYNDTFPCNPDENCTCWLVPKSKSVHKSKSVCDQSCVCGRNSTGRLCSLCKDGFYKDGRNCYKCQKVSHENVVIATTITLIFVILFTTWILNKNSKRFCGCSSKRARTANFLVFSAMSTAVVFFGFFHVIPAWITEVYVLLVVLLVFARLKSIKPFILTTVMYVQILDSLNVSDLRTDCGYCSFAAILGKLKVFKASRWIKNLLNFNFNGFACLMPFLYTPLGRLAFLAVLPILGGVIGFIFRLTDYYFRLINCNKQNEVKNKVKLLEKAKRKSKEQLILLLNIFYFPISNEVVKALLPCVKYPELSLQFMKVYPWIDCFSSVHTEILILASFIAAVYIAMVPAVFLVLLRKRIAVVEKFKNERRRRPPMSSLDTLYRGFKKPYWKFMTVLLMLRRLAVAAIVSVFPYSQRDVQAIPFNILLLSCAHFTALAKPYESYTKYNLESWADVGACLTILVTYNCMANREKASEISEIIILAVNVAFILFVVGGALVHLRAPRKRRFAKKYRQLDHVCDQNNV